jgi:hypothetical protein
MVPGSRQRRFDYYHHPRYTRHPLIASPLLLSMQGSSNATGVGGTLSRYRFRLIGGV